MKKAEETKIQTVNGFPYVFYKEGKNWVTQGRLDPTYTFKVPKGALPGDPWKQIFWPEKHQPKLYYKDIPFVCAACKKKVVFEAKEQKFLFEERKFNFDYFPKECRECRESLNTGVLEKVTREGKQTYRV